MSRDPQLGSREHSDDSQNIITSFFTLITEPEGNWYTRKRVENKLTFRVHCIRNVHRVIIFNGVVSSDMFCCVIFVYGIYRCYGAIQIRLCVVNSFNVFRTTGFLDFVHRPVF
jgi:hypothetical protein